MTGKALIDANILIYAHDIKSPFFTVAQNFLKAQLQEGLLCVSPQVLLEAYRILTQKIKKPISPHQAWQVVDFYSRHGNINFIYPSNSTLEIAKKLALKYKVKGAYIFDVYHVATMIDSKVQLIYTANTKDFSRFSEIKTINPLN